MDREQQRSELYKGIWQIANDLRGAVDGWDFKNYVLGMLFYRYISENMTGYINKGEHDAGNTDFDYAEMSDEDAKEAREGLIEEKGFFILPSELFCNVRKNANNNENLNETLDKVFRDIEESSIGTESERDMKGLFDDIDVNSNKLGGSVSERNKRLVSLLNGIGSMNLGSYEDNSIDAFGDAYEYLMGMYAANAGKSGGEYFTPQEVSRLLTLIGLNGRKQVNKVYDPACGSGSLLLQSAKILGNDNVRLGYYGQEKNVTTYNLCRINMFLHNIGYEKFDIAQGDTLTDPKHWDDEPFDLIVSNPPYSTKWVGDSDSVLANDERFNVAGALAPKSKADLAFVMHSLSWLSNEGTAAIVCFPGIMYRGGKEKTIRKYLVERNFVDAVIQMPSNLFYGTSIQTCLLILRKAKENDKTVFIDASAEFVSATNSNKLSEENIQTIPNGNMSAFYSNIGKAVDTAIGYTYPAFQKRIDKVHSLGEKLNIVINIIERFNIGLILFDEIQMFLTSKNSGNRKVNVKTESFQAITTIMNSTGVSIGVIGTEIAYRLIFEDQIHQNRRLGKTIYADSYCSNQTTFMRILNSLIEYQWTDVKITKEDLTPDLLKAFMDCTHGIIDLVIGLYSAIQHEALITDRKTKINDSFVRKVAKKYYPNLMKTIDGIDASEYDRTRLAEIEEANRLMKKDISKQSETEHERTISKLKNKPSDKDMLIKSAVSKITAVSDDFKVNSIIDASKQLYETGNYSVTDEKQFTRDVMKVLSGKKIRAKKKPDRVSKDIMMQFLDNDTQNTN